MVRDRGAKPPRKEVSHDEGTLLKVYLGLREAGVVGQQAVDAVSCMTNQGVLFRELMEEVTDGEVSTVA